MSFDANNNDIVLRLNGLGYAESSQVVNFENAPATEYANTFILRIPESELSSAEDTLSDRYRDRQSWQVQIAFDRSEFNEIANRDTLYRKREDIIKDLDNPANWGAGVLKRRYKNSTVEETDNYFVLTIILEVIDQVTY